VKNQKRSDIDWRIIQELKAESGMPVFAKGIMCKEDARIALEAGVDGIYISNHGTRQLDTSPATVEVLVEIVTEADKYAQEKKEERRPIWFDGNTARI